MDKAWTLGRLLDGPSREKAEQIGLAAARQLWRQGVAGVRVTIIEPVVLLEKMRDT